MNISNKGIELIKQFEGCRLKAYQDSVGVWTIGYGHTESVQLLLANGANTDAVDQNGFTAVDIALFYGHTDTQKWLLEKQEM